jgi:ribosomal protein S16
MQLSVGQPNSAPQGGLAVAQAPIGMPATLSVQQSPTPQAGQPLSLGNNTPITVPQPQQSPIVEAVNTAMERGASPDQIVQKLIQSNPDKQQEFQTAIQRGAQPQDIINEVLKQNGGQATDTTAAGQTTDQATEQPKSVMGYLGNTIGATGTLVKNIIGGLVNILNTNPDQNTIVNVAKVAGGLLASPVIIGHNLITGKNAGEQGSWQLTDKPLQNLLDSLGNRYGSMDKFKETLYTDTPGVLLDLATVLEPAMKGVGLAGDVVDATDASTMAAKTNAAAIAAATDNPMLRAAATQYAGESTNALSKAGEIGGKVAETINPVNQTFKAAGKVADLVGTGASKALGLTTSAGSESIRQAFTNPSDTQAAAMRGNMSPEQIVSDAKDALGQLKEDRGTAYRQQLAQVKESTLPQDTAPVNAALNKSLNDFGVKVLTDESGKPMLDFKTSTISDPAEQGRIQRIYNDVTNWQDTTGGGLDTLKRRVGSEWSQNSDVRAFTQSVKSSIRGVLNDGIPGYQQMTSGYEQASNLINDIQKTLSLGDKASVDTAFKKLTTALKDNNEMRTELIGQLQDAGGKDLMGSISGYQLNPVVPRGVFGRGIDLIAGGSIIHGLAALFSPQTLAAFAVSSPRLVGEVARGLGLTKQALVSGINALPTAIRSNVGRVATGSAFVNARTAPQTKKQLGK